jgi:hypothetical protein
MKVNQVLNRFRGVRLALVALALAFTLCDSEAAVLCSLRLGAGCNGPMVYEYQLCRRITTNQGECKDLCAANRPICSVSDFDSWVSAYSRRGHGGYKGELANSSTADDYDQFGQLFVTSGQTYTVCRRTRGAVGGWSSSTAVSPSVTCPGVFVASEKNCSAGTVFNGDPINPKCITNDSYCSGGGSAGNFAVTMNAGFQMVAVQNEHFVDHPGEDSSEVHNASTAGTTLAGLVAPVAGSANLNAASFKSSNSTGRGSPASAAGAGTVGVGEGTASLAATASDEGMGGENAKGKDGLLGEIAYGKQSIGEGDYQASAGSGAVNAGTSSGASWFGSGSSGGSATAGASSGDIGFEGGSGGASRGLASSGTLNVEDPENYFMLSDVDVSLFKRVTAQCRKKERSLVLAR